MSKKEIAKKAFEAVEKESKEKQIAELKKIIKATLEKLEKKKESKALLEKEIKILKSDIDNLRDGRLDLVKERQEKDPIAKEVSVFVIINKIDVDVPIWKQPYNWGWNLETNSTANVHQAYLNDTLYGCSYTISNDIAKNNTSGTYLLSDGEVKYL